MGHGQGSEGDPDPLRTGKAEEGPRSLGPSWLSAAPPSDRLLAPPRSWPSAPSPLHSSSAFPACLFSGPDELSSSSPQEGTQARGHIQTLHRSMGPGQAPGAQEIQGQPPDYLPF